MRRKDDIFDSNAERQLYATLASNWSPEYDIIPQLPLSKIVKVEPGELSSKELEYFYKANLDLTLCKNNRPLLTVEFDGIGRGFSKAGEYIQLQPTPDRYRKLKMDFKLRIAKTVSYPLAVVSFEETMLLDETDAFTILDGIVGQFLSWRAVPKYIDELLEGGDQEELERMSPWERDEYYQDLVLQAEVLSDMGNDPIFRKSAEYQRLCSQFGVVRFGYELLHDPETPSLSGIPPLVDPVELQARTSAINRAECIGCRWWVETPNRNVAKTIWLRNFEVIGVSPLSVAINLAGYVTFKAAYQSLLD